MVKRFIVFIFGSLKRPGRGQQAKIGADAPAGTE